MTEYVCALMRLYPKLEGYCLMTDKALEKTGCNARQDTMTLIKEMERLISLKKGLVNLSLIFEEMIKGLSERELLALSLESRRGTFAEIAGQLQTSLSSAVRFTAKAKNKCARSLERFNIKNYADILDRFL